MRELRIQKLISKHLSLYSSPKFTTGYVKLLRKPPIVFQTGWDILVIFVSTYLMSRCFFYDPTNEAIPNDACDEKYAVYRCYGNAR